MTPPARPWLPDFNLLIAPPGQRDRRTKASLERLSLQLRSRDTESRDFRLAMHSAHNDIRREERWAGGDPLQKLLSEPWKVHYISAKIKLARAKTEAPFPSRLTEPEVEVLKNLGEDTFTAVITPALCTELYDSLHYTGAWRILGVNEILAEGPNLKFPVLTARPDAKVILTESSGLVDEAGLSGVQPSGDLEVVAARLLVSLQAFQDSQVLVPALLEHFRDSINLRLEYLAWSATGAADENNGSMTGITQHANTVVVNAAAGNVSVQTLDRGDLVNLIDGPDSPALQRRPSFSAHPDLLAPLMQVTDPGGSPVVTVDPDIPGETIFRLLGFPLYLTAGAPSTNAANSKVLTFGDHRAMGLGIRKTYALEASHNSRWANLQIDYRGWTRARAEMRKGTMLAVLRTAAV